MDRRFGLKSNCIKDMINIFRTQPEVEEAVIFGSRAMGTYKNGSDIDIALKGDSISFDTISSVRIRLGEMPYAYTYDIINYHKISSKALIAHIDELGIRFYEKGQVQEGWKRYKLGDLITLNYGKSLIADSRKKGQIPVFSSSGISGWHNEPIVKSEGVIVGRKGNVGRVYYSDRPFYCIDTAYYILPNIQYDLKFIYYKLKSLNLVKLTSDSAVPGLNRETAYAQEISIPESIDEQTAIASILSSLDDKIEINLQMNQTLEAMAQAIFKEWFVKFNFPGFDGQVVDGLPKGWNIWELSNLISVKDGTHDSPKQQKNGKYLITSKHLKNNYIDFETAYKISEEDFANINKRSKVDKYDILITMIGTVGNLYFIHDEKIDFAIKNIGLFKTSKRKELAYYIYFCLDSKETTDYFTKRLAGSTQQYLTLESLRQTPIIIPDVKTLSEFNYIGKSIYEKIESNSIETRALTILRDTLLPKLMSGKIRVNEDAHAETQGTQRGGTNE